METKTTRFAVSEQTALYIEAVRALNNAGSAILTALLEHYGGQQGETIYNDEFLHLYDEIRKKIGDYLTISVEENCCGTKSPNII